MDILTQPDLLKAAKAEFDGLLLVPPQAGGLHLLAWPQPALAARMSDREASLRARENDIVAPPLSASFWVDPSGHDERPRQALILGYAAVTESEMRPAAARLAAALQA